MNERMEIKTMILLGVHSGTYERLNGFMNIHNLQYPNYQLRTTEDTIDFLIQSIEFYQMMVTEEDIKGFLKKRGLNENDLNK